MISKILLIALGGVVLANAQSATVSAGSASPSPHPSVPLNPSSAVSPPRTSLPPYVVYHHFLAWVTQLDNAATAAGASDTYAFAQAFSRANLQPAQLDILRAAAHSLDADLQAQNAKAQTVIAAYRASAKQAVAQGGALPPLPQTIHDLDRERGALFINHYISLRSALGPSASASLDSYLSYEFAPHVKLSPVNSQVGPVQAPVAAAVAK